MGRDRVTAAALLDGISGFWHDSAFLKAARPGQCDPGHPWHIGDPMSWPLLLASSPAGGAQRSPLIDLIPFALVFVIIYFLLIAPARRQKKQLQELIDNLKSGDKVVTSGGLYGTVVSVGEDVIKLRVANNVQLDVARSAITGKQPERS
jgi:preprotein translocase subunit YajC